MSAPVTWLVTGATGQLGTDLQAVLAERPGDAVTAVGRDRLDLTDEAGVRSVVREWLDESAGRRPVLVNAAAYTAVDAAETDEATAELVNGAAPGWLAQELAGRGRLVHVSTDYVFDGTVAEHPEDERFSPLGVYGQTKAAGDALVATLPSYYLVRTSWVIGAGANFVATMASLADRGITPSVVADQDGRLTFTSEIARAVDHLLAVAAPSGTYNLSGAGEVTSWADIARMVFNERGRPGSDVTSVTAAEYGAGRALAPRPRHSAFTLDKIRATGFEPAPVADLLSTYLRSV